MKKPGIIKYGSQKGPLCDLTPLFVHVLDKKCIFHFLRLQMK